MLLSPGFSTGYDFGDGGRRDAKSLSVTSGSPLLSGHQVHCSVSGA